MRTKESSAEITTLDSSLEGPDKVNVPSPEYLSQILAGVYVIPRSSDHLNELEYKHLHIWWHMLPHVHAGMSNMAATCARLCQREMDTGRED